MVVPADFLIESKRMYKKISRINYLNVIQIINEPTAAALLIFIIIKNILIKKRKVFNMILQF